MKKPPKPPPEISPEIRRLLDFANRGKHPGKFSEPSSKIIEDRREEEKRDPQIPIPDFSTLIWGRSPRGTGKVAQDKAGNWWELKHGGKEPLRVGRVDILPDMGDSDADRKLARLWVEIRDGLSDILKARGSNSDCDEFLTYFLQKEPGPRLFVADGRVQFGDIRPSERGWRRRRDPNYPPTEPQDQCQSLMGIFADFYLNQTDLHPLLRVCPTCGRFWMGDTKRGRPQMFCEPGGICEKLYHLPNGQLKLKWAKKARATQKRLNQAKDRPQMLNLAFKHFSRKRDEDGEPLFTDSQAKEAAQIDVDEHLEKGWTLERYRRRMDVDT